jgi:glycosyltransferase involved in cell wall biosynthesis
MRARGHRVLLACDPRGELFPRARKEGFATQPLTFGGWHNLGAGFSLRHLLNQEAVEILNTHSSQDSWVGLLAWRTLGKRRPLLVRTRHLSTPVHNNWPTRRLYQAPAALLTTSRGIKELLASRLHVPASRIFSIPTGVSLTEFAPRDPDPAWRVRLTIPAEAFIFGTVAVLRSWKGHLFLLEALAELLRESPAPYLVIVGDGPYWNVIEEKIRSLDLGKWVRLVGHQDDVAGWFALMDAAVLASYANEGVPQALLQALAMAKPVVATTVGGIPEVVIPDETGLLVPPRDPRALAQAMRRLMQNRAYGRELGQRGREVVVANFSQEQMAAAVEAVYDEIWERKLSS